MSLKLFLETCFGHIYPSSSFDKPTNDWPGNGNSSFVDAVLLFTGKLPRYLASASNIEEQSAEAITST